MLPRRATVSVGAARARWTMYWSDRTRTTEPELKVGGKRTRDRVTEQFACRWSLWDQLGNGLRQAEVRRRQASLEAALDLRRPRFDAHRRRGEPGAGRPEGDHAGGQGRANRHPIDPARGAEIALVRRFKHATVEPS